MASDLQHLEHRTVEPDEQWAGAVVRTPAYIQETEDGPFQRPWMILWLASESGAIRLTEPRANEEAVRADFEKELGVFMADEKNRGRLPAMLRVQPGALSRDSLARFTEQGVKVFIEDEVSPVLGVVEDLSQQMNPRAGRSPLRGKGVTIPRLRDFFEAATAFFNAAPWRFLTDADLILVENETFPDSLRHAAVMGAADILFGLHFYESRETFEKMQDDPEQFYNAMMGQMEDEDEDASPDDDAAEFVESLWQVNFDMPEECFIPDQDIAFAKHFPLPPNGMIPTMADMSPSNSRPLRPGITKLAAATNLLWALAKTTEAQIESGRWSVQVQSAEGKRTVTLALPGVLEFDEDDEAVAAAVGPIEKAQALVDRAMSERGRAVVRLSKAALALDPDCAEALAIIGNREIDKAKRLEYMQKADASARGRTGPSATEEENARLWQIRMTLAETYKDLDRPDEALKVLNELLERDPEDRFNTRYAHMQVLLQTSRDAEAAELAQRYSTQDAIWLYFHALISFRATGPGPESERRLRQAILRNDMLAGMLLGEVPELEADDDVDEEVDTPTREAVRGYVLLHPVWEQTPGATDFLRRVRSVRSNIGLRPRSRNPR